jgi:hypothetical protein
MQIRIQSTGEVVSEQGFRAMHPNISMPQQLTEATINELGGDVVFEGPQASGGTVYQYSQAAGVEQIGGKWYTKYILGPVFTDGETTAAAQEAAYKAAKDAKQAKSVRATRDAKLAATDWVVIKALETATAVPAETATLRQALRDLPTQAGFPWEITWPDAEETTTP